MSERWIQASKKLLEQIEKIEKNEDVDRLELVRSIIFMLGGLQRSVVGWLQWVNNPNIMTKFSKEELEEIRDNMANMIKSFIKYDIEVTKLGGKKGLKERKRTHKRGSTGEIYVY